MRHNYEMVIHDILYITAQPIEIATGSHTCRNPATPAGISHQETGGLSKM